MRVLILANFFSLAFFGLSAQTLITKAELAGKWEPTSMSVNDLFHDFKSDSTYLPQAAKKSFRNAEDSAMTVSMLSFIFDMMKGTTFNFGKDSVYSEINSAQKAKNGTYTFIEKNNILTTFIRNKKQEFKTAFTNGILSLTTVEDDKTMVLFLRKLKTTQ